MFAGLIVAGLGGIVGMAMRAAGLGKDTKASVQG
jgi:hypothetical protein